MSIDDRSKPSTAPIKRKAPASPPDTLLDEPDPMMEPKKPKIDPILQTASPISLAATPNLNTRSSSSPHEPSTPLSNELPTRSIPPAPPPPPPPPPRHTSTLAPIPKRPSSHLQRRPTLQPAPYFHPSRPTNSLTFAREAARRQAATHLKRARDDLVESIRLEGLNRSIIPADPSSIAEDGDSSTERPPPPPLSSPSPPASPPPVPGEEEQQGLGILDFDFVGYGRGKQDGEFKAGDCKGKNGWEDGALQIEEEGEAVQGEEKEKPRMEERVVGSADGDDDDDGKNKEQSPKGKAKGQGKEGVIGLD
ncbi:MAG: hypothetical protein Q9178_007646 [Gyalolechia marmorata]